jgi:hypothetical protein
MVITKNSSNCSITIFSSGIGLKTDDMLILELGVSLTLPFDELAL